MNVSHSKLAVDVGSAFNLKGAPLFGVARSYLAWREVFMYVPYGLFFLLVAGILFSLLKRKWLVVSMGLWAALLFSLVAAQLLHIPTANKMEHFAIMIAMYIPLSIVGAWVLDEFILNSNLALMQKPRLRTLLFLALAILIAVGFFKQTNLANPSFFSLIRSPDLLAMAWIEENIPADSLILVEGLAVPSSNKSGFGSAVGTDAGWWLPLYTHKSVTIPPQYAMLNEQPSQPGYNKGILELYTKLEKYSLILLKVSRHYAIMGLRTSLSVKVRAWSVWLTFRFIPKTRWTKALPLLRSIAATWFRYTGSTASFAAQKRSSHESLLSRDVS